MSDNYNEMICEFHEKEQESGSSDFSLMNLFLDDIKDFKMLSADEEIELGKRISKGDISARNELVNANYRLVIKLAKNYTYTGLDLEDLIQYGCLGLMRAADKFDYTLGFRFSTMAVHWILQSIRRGIQDTGRTIRIPAHLQDDISKQNKSIAHLTQEFGRAPSVSEISNETGFSESKVLNLFSITPNTVSLDQSINDDENSDFYEIVSDDAVVNPEERYIKDSLRTELDKAFKTLTERESEVIQLRYGWNHEEAQTLEQIAKQFGITRERVRQIESDALRKLKTGSASASLKEYIAA